MDSGASGHVAVKRLSILTPDLECAPEGGQVARLEWGLYSKLDGGRGRLAVFACVLILLGWR